MSEKRVYQDKMLSSEKEIVVCNWERGEGKTYSIFKKIMESKNGKYLYISSFEARTLQDYFKEYTHKESDSIKLYKSSRNKDYIEFNNGDRIEVFYIKPDTQFRGARNIKIAFFDECYLNKEYIDSVLKPMEVKQVYCMITNDSIEYIGSRKENELWEWLELSSNPKNLNTFIDASIMKLINEFSNIPQTEKTTMTRNSILDMIGKLQALKK